ncbi:MAG: peptidoglycan-binding protein [Bacillaceae bacterium]|nr:peptidoglycan-binding protein [Bacillaceae bacterium]
MEKIEQILASHLQEGVRHSDVIKLKKNLARLGFSVSNNPTDWYGPVTTRTVKEFQKAYDYPQSGIADEKTLALIAEILSLVLREGVRHQAVVQLKLNLEKVGFKVSDNPNDYYGPVTARKVRDFQRAHSLPVNGVADERVFLKINEILNEPLQNGARNNRVIKLKRDLEQAGFKVSNNPNNFFGSQTERKVRDFQRYHKIPVTGIADNLTLTRLDDVLNGRVRPSLSHVVNGKQVYTYEQMEKDILALQRMYPDIITTEVIGKSLDGRDIHAIKLGTGPTEVFINGSHHAREHMTTNVVMNMLDKYAFAYARGNSIGGLNAKTVLDRTSIWFVPNVNPDGVALVQQGPNAIRNNTLRRNAVQINGGSNNFDAWKANVRGVDLNRQYPALWDTITNNPGRPSPANYKGPRPLSEPEALALYNFTLKKDFKTTVSYHSSGEVIFVRNPDHVARMVSDATGYPIVDLTNSRSGGGYSTWFNETYRRPGLTPEISPYVGPRPVPLRNWDTIWTQNESVGLLVADEAHRNRNRR